MTTKNNKTVGPLRGSLSQDVHLNGTSGPGNRQIEERRTGRFLPGVPIGAQLGIGSFKTTSPPLETPLEKRVIEHSWGKAMRNWVLQAPQYS